MYLRESQLERSRPPDERRARGHVVKTGMPPVPPVVNAGYANSLGVEYFSLPTDREQRRSDPPATMTITIATKG